jgi:glycosyltransferase involved in cell wall biosynthesis
MGAVTVIIPTRDRLELLDLTLTSVLRQRNVELSVTVVDDGSIEDVGTVVARRSDARVRCVRHEVPQGVSRSRNRGWMEATTEWVAFCDDDDLWSPDKLHRQVKAAEESGRDWAYAGSVSVNHELRVQMGAPPLDPDAMVAALPRHNAMPAGASNVLVRRTVLQQVGGFDPSLTHVPDWDLWLRLARHGKPASVREASVAYRLHGGNASFRTAEMLAELGQLERRYHVRADRARFHRHLAYLCMRSGRHREALGHFTRAYVRIQDRYTRLDVAHDLRLVREQAIEGLRRRLGRQQPAAPRSAPQTTGDPQAAWRAHAQAWIDELLREAAAATNAGSVTAPPRNATQ